MANTLNFKGVKGLHYIHGNIRSLFNKINQLKLYLVDSNISCLGLSETWLTNTIPDNMLYIPGYSLLRLDRSWLNPQGQIKKGGGVCCYINTNMKFTHQEFDDLNCSNKDIEIHHILIEQPAIKKCILLNIYRPPQGSIDTFTEKLINNILNKKQGGFRKNNSTINSVSEFSHEIYEAINQKNISLATFIDFSKAFDTVNHQILLEKLNICGIKNKNKNWIQNYLSNRKQSTVVNGSTSDLLNVTCGVPQGSILGPLLFLIYINDLSHMVNNTSMYLYADDTVLLSNNPCINTCTENMQRDLIIIAKWCQSNKLSLNIKKTKCMLFGSRVRLKRTRQPKLYINNTLVDFVHQYKYLGVILDSHLTFNKHLNNIIKITAHKINLLAKIRQYLTEFASITIYKTMILPYFDYGDILFINSSKKQLNKLDHLQKRAIKICLKMGQNIPEEMLLRDAKVAKLDNRREAHLLNYMYKKKDCIELLDIKKINTRARAAPLFKTIIPKCEKYKHSVFYHGAIKWNSLPVKIRNISTYNSFKLLQKKNMLNY